MQTPQISICLASLRMWSIPLHSRQVRIGFASEITVANANDVWNKRPGQVCLHFYITSAFPCPSRLPALSPAPSLQPGWERCEFASQVAGNSISKSLSASNKSPKKAKVPWAKLHRRWKVQSTGGWARIVGRPLPTSGHGLIWAPLRLGPRRGKGPRHLSCTNMAASITVAGKGAAQGQGHATLPKPPSAPWVCTTREQPPPSSSLCASWLPAFGALLKRPTITSLHLTLQKVTSAPPSSMQHVWQGIAMATFLSGLSHWTAETQSVPELVTAQVNAVLWGLSFLLSFVQLTASWSWKNLSCVSNVLPSTPGPNMSVNLIFLLQVSTAEYTGKLTNNSYSF